MAIRVQATRIVRYAKSPSLPKGGVHRVKAHPCFDKDSMKLPFRPEPSPRPKVLGAAMLAETRRGFDEDKTYFLEITLADWRNRPWKEKISGHALSIFRSQI